MQRLVERYRLGLRNGTKHLHLLHIHTETLPLPPYWMKNTEMHFIISLVTEVIYITKSLIHQCGLKLR